MAYDSYFFVTNHEDEVHYHEDLEFDIERGDLVVIDEVDHFIYDNPEKFFQFQLGKKILGFTATAST